MVGGDSHRVKKFQKTGLYLFGVCLFFGVRKKKSGAPENNNGGNEWAGPPTPIAARHPSMHPPCASLLWASLMSVHCRTCPMCFQYHHAPCFLAIISPIRYIMHHLCPLVVAGATMVTHKDNGGNLIRALFVAIVIEDMSLGLCAPWS